MATSISKVATGIALALISVMVGYIMFNSLFTPTNEAVVDVNGTLVDAGYDTEADLAVTAWKLYLLAIPLTLLAGAIFLIVQGFRGK